MAWIESHQSLKEHPKTRKLARLLGVTVPAAIGHLHCLWWWCVEYAPDGALARYDPEDIAAACMWDGDPAEFLDALLAARFVDADPLRVHDWEEYAGRLVRQREAAKERTRAWRSRTAVPSAPVAPAPSEPVMHNVRATCAATVQNSTVQDHTVQEKPESVERESARKPPPVRASRAARPLSVDEVSRFFATKARDYPAVVGTPEQQARQAELYFNHYTANGWRVGRTPMKDWQAAGLNWLGHALEFTTAPAAPRNGSGPPSASFEEQVNARTVARYADRCKGD